MASPTTCASNNTDFKINHNESKKDASNYIVGIVVNSWRLKRREVDRLRKRLTLQTVAFRQLQLQTVALRAIVEDPSHQTLQMAEVSRIREKLLASAKENSLLDDEKHLLECSARQRVGGLQSLWQSCKSDLSAARADAAAAHRLLLAERNKLKQAREENMALAQKVSDSENSLLRTLNELKRAKEEAADLKKIITSKDEHILMLETDLEESKQFLKQSIIEAEGAINKLRKQLEIANEKINKWPFHGCSWPASIDLHIPAISHTSFLWENRCSYFIQGFLNTMLSIIC